MKIELKKFRRPIILFYISFSLLLTNFGRIFGQSSNLLDSVTARYQSQIPFKLTIEIYYLKDNQQDMIKGQFYLGENNCFKMIFPEQEIHYDGNWLWSYDKLNNQVIVEQFQPTTAFRIIYELLNGNYKNFKIAKVEKIKSKNLWTRITFVSSDKDALFKTLSLVLDDSSKSIIQAEYVDFQNQKWRIKFGKAEKVEGVNFKKFTPPSDIELIDLRPKGKK